MKIKKHKMKNKQLLVAAQQIIINCYEMLENAPQTMSNVQPILDVLNSAMKLRTLLSKLNGDD